jgi:hypothetical protein
MLTRKSKIPVDHQNLKDFNKQILRINMRKYIIILITLLSSCGQEDRLNNDFYEVVNIIFGERLHEVGILYLETTPIFNGPVSDGPPTHIALANLKRFAEMDLIDTGDIDFLFSQVDSSVYNMNPGKLTIKALDKKAMDNLLITKSQDIYDYLQETYNTKCYAKVSLPLISKDKLKIIIYVDVYCGFFDGQGYEFIFHKINGRWQIIRDGGTWES